MFARVRELAAGVPGVGVGIRKHGALKTLQMADVKVADTTSCVAATWTRVGSYTVRPQTTQRWGFGKSGITNSNQGILYFLPKAPGAVNIACGVRLAIYDSEDRPRDFIIHNVRSERLTKDLSDGKELVFFLPESGVVAREDDKLVVEINADSAATFSGTASTLRADTTIYI